MDFRKNLETGILEYNPKPELPGGTERTPDGVQTLPGSDTGGQDTENKYDRDKYQGPTDSRTDRVSVGKNPAEVPTGQG